MVQRLVSEAQKQPEKLRDKKAKEKDRELAKEATEQVAAKMIMYGKGITSAKKV